MASYYRARVEIDLYKFVDFFEILDIWISQVYLKGNIRWDDQEAVMFNHYTKQECLQLSTLTYSANKLTKLANRIVHELYRDQYSIDPYAHTNTGPLKETMFMSEAFIYSYFLRGQDQEIISEYIGSQEKYEKILDDALSYQDTLLDSVQSILSSHPLIEEDINWLLGYLLNMKLKRLREIKQVIKNLYDANTDFAYGDFFTSLETLGFYILLEGNKDEACDTEYLTQERIFSIATTWAQKYADCTEETFKYLAAYLIQLLNLIHHYSCTYIHERYGVVKDPSHLSCTRDLEFAAQMIGSTATSSIELDHTLE